MVERARSIAATSAGAVVLIEKLLHRFCGRCHIMIVSGLSRLFSPDTALLLTSSIAPDFLRKQSFRCAVTELPVSLSREHCAKSSMLICVSAHRHYRLHSGSNDARGRRNAETVGARGVMTWSGRPHVMKIPVWVS